MDEQRYAPMSPEEFAQLRKETNAELDLNNRGAGIGGWWARRLSRALDVIARVTDERDRCSKARIEQQDYQKGYQDGLNAAHADEAELRTLAFEAARALPKGAGYTAIANARLLLAQQYGTTESLLLYARRAVSEGGLPGMRAEVAAAILRLHEEQKRGAVPLSGAVTEDMRDLVGPTPEEIEPEKRCGTCDLQPSTEAERHPGPPNEDFVALQEGRMTPEQFQKKHNWHPSPEYCPWKYQGTAVYAALGPFNDNGPPWENCRFWKPRA